MSVGLPIADAIAIAETHRWHPAPPASGAPAPWRAASAGARVRAQSAYAVERAASRWADFLVDAAFRAAAAAAVRRPHGVAARAV